MKRDAALIIKNKVKCKKKKKVLTYICNTAEETAESPKDFNS